MWYQNIENTQVIRFKQKMVKITCENGALEIVS